MRTVKYSELKKLLRKVGCRIKREGSDHELWINPKTNEPFTVPRHGSKEVPAGTLNSIKRKAGLE